MRARFINEIKKGNSGWSSIGVGRTALLNIPKRFKEMAKNWDWNDFYDGRTDISMNATYSVNGNIHTLTFDWVYNIMQPRDKIHNPSIAYDEKNQTVTVFHGDVAYKDDIKESQYEKFDLDNESDFDRVVDGLDNEWANDFYYMLVSNVEDYGNANAESVDDIHDIKYRDYRPDTGGLNY